MRTIILFATLALAASAAQATVIYNWQPISQSANFAALDGTIGFTDAAWSLGGSIDHATGPGFDDYDRTSPVRFVTMDFADHPSLFANVNPVGQRGSRDGASVTAHLSFTAAGMLAGSLLANDTEDDFEMASSAGSSVMAFTRFGSDFANAHNPDLDSDPCFHQKCVGDTGATGRWVLDQSTVPGDSPTAVAEPAPLALFALAVLGMGWAARRERARYRVVMTLHR